MVLSFYHGLHSLQTLLPLNTFGVISKNRLKEYDHPPSGILELWERVGREWNKIQPEVVQNLIESMPRRVAAVVKAKGGYTKY